MALRRCHQLGQQKFSQDILVRILDGYIHTIVCESPPQGLAQQTVLKQQKQVEGKHVKHSQFNAHN